MSVFEISNPAGLYDPTPNGYSHVASVAANARWVVIAGQGGEDAHGERSPDFATQVEQAYRNIVTALRSVNASPRDIVKLTMLVVDHTQDKLPILGAAAFKVFGPDVKPPPATLIPVPRLALDDMLFEVDAIAAIK